MSNYISVSIQTPLLNKTIGFISNEEEFKHALKELERTANLILKGGVK